MRALLLSFPSERDDMVLMISRWWDFRKLTLVSDFGRNIPNLASEPKVEEACLKTFWNPPKILLLDTSVAVIPNRSVDSKFSLRIRLGFFRWWGAFTGDEVSSRQCQHYGILCKGTREIVSYTNMSWIDSWLSVQFSSCLGVWKNLFSLQLPAGVFLSYASSWHNWHWKRKTPVPLSAVARMDAFALEQAAMASEGNFLQFFEVDGWGLDRYRYSLVDWR